MCKNIETSVKIDGEQSKKFKMRVGIHQSLVFNPLLCAVVMDEVTKDINVSGVKELLYADDLVLLGDSWQEVDKKCAQQKKALTDKGLKVIM